MMTISVCVRLILLEISKEAEPEGFFFIKYKATTMHPGNTGKPWGKPQC